MLWDLALSSHGSYVTRDAAVIPSSTSPVYYTGKSMVLVYGNLLTNLLPLRGNFAHRMAELALMAQPTEISVRSLPPVTNRLTSLKAILPSQWAKHCGGEALEDRAHVRETTSGPCA